MLHVQNNRVTATLQGHWQNACANTVRVTGGEFTAYRVLTPWFDNVTDGETAGYIRNTAGDGYKAVADRFIPLADGTQNLGDASHRWSTVYASTGAINTSDARDKTDVAELNAAERRAATAIRKLIRKYRFNDVVARKGALARTHIGVIAQEVVAAMAAENLDPMRYGFVCYDEWTDTQKIKGEVVATPRSRYGLRYDELAMFLLASA